METPCLPAARPIAETIESRRDRLVIAYFREFLDEFQGCLFRVTGLFAGGVARHLDFAVDAAFPVQGEQMIAPLLVIPNDDFLNQRIQKLRCQFGGISVS